jgi:hypothetical protein
MERQIKRKEEELRSQNLEFRSLKADAEPM